MKTLVALAALGLSLASAVPAQASGLSIGIRSGNVAVTYRDYPGYYHGYGTGRHWADRDEIRRSIYRAGYVQIYDIDRYGDYYRARVVNPRGIVFALTLDGYSGGIVRADIVGRERFHRW
jgi:hypothetical protein